MGRELKFVDTEIQGSAAGVTWTQLEDNTVDGISICSQGDGESQCIGREYSIHSIHTKGIIFYTAGEAAVAPANDIFLRMVWFVDTQANGAIPTAGQWISTDGTVDALGFRNLEFTKRFRFLKDMSMSIKPGNMNEGAVNSFATGQTVTPFEFNYKFKTPLVVRRTGTTQVVASIADNVIHCWLISNEANQVSVSVQHRCRFTG